MPPLGQDTQGGNIKKFQGSTCPGFSSIIEFLFILVYIMKFDIRFCIIY